MSVSCCGKFPQNFPQKQVEFSPHIVYPVHSEKDAASGRTIREGFSDMDVAKNPSRHRGLAGQMRN